jgi:hypothetical protein
MVDRLAGPGSQKDLECLVEHLATRSIIDLLPGLGELAGELVPPRPHAADEAATQGDAVTAIDLVRGDSHPFYGDPAQPVDRKEAIVATHQHPRRNVRPPLQGEGAFTRASHWRRPLGRRPCQRHIAACRRQHASEHGDERGTLAAMGLAVAPLGDQWLRGSDQARGPSFAPRPILGSPPRVPSSGRCADPRGQTAAKANLARAWRVSFNHTVGSGRSSRTPLRTAAGDGDLGSPLQHLLA